LHQEFFGMIDNRIGHGAILILALTAAGILLATPSRVLAQETAAGVYVDAQGVMHKRLVADPTGTLMRQQIAAAKAALNPDVLRFSKMRKVSLNRLEQAIIANGGAPTDEMLHLAGLLRVQYVFCYPESGDIVIAGPAEGWAANPAGRVVGITSRRPTLKLEDLVVALRAFPPGEKGAGVIGCSIDPTEEGLAAMQDYLNRVGSRLPGPPNAVVANQIAAGLQNALGLQNVTVNGVSPKTHFAQVMVEADYRMKLIGIGLEQPPVRLASYVQLANPSQVARNAMQRWYFTPDYECVRVSQDGLAMQLVGDGVKLIGEDELVRADGTRGATGSRNAASQMFVTGFTKRYPELAERSPVYAELRNLIDLSIAAAFTQKHGYYSKANWNMPFLGSEEKYAVQRYDAPKKVGTAVNAVFKHSRLMTPIGGGVQILANRALESGNLLSDEKGEVARTHDALKVELAQGRWWWD